MQPDEPERRAALAHLHTFGSRILPGTVRRIAGWKRLARGELPDLLDELLQELAVDCLQHASLITTLTTAQRHGRWMRLAERWVYRHYVRPRLAAGAPVARPSSPPPDDPGATALPDLPEGAVRLANGRWNLSASAVRDRRPVAELRHELERLAAQLGCDGERDAFWRARLAEALTGLAADLLQQRGGLRLLVGTRRAPDPERRVQRLRALRRHFQLRPSTIDVRRLVRTWASRTGFDRHAPRRLLQDAVQVWPQSAPAWAWLAEACLADGDPAATLAAARDLRRLGTPQRSRAVLLRARVLELRGRWPAALALLERAVRRRPHDARLRRALQQVRG